VLAGHAADRTVLRGYGHDAGELPGYCDAGGKRKGGT